MRLKRAMTRPSRQTDGEREAPRSGGEGGAAGDRPRLMVCNARRGGLQRANAPAEGRKWAWGDRDRPGAVSAGKVRVCSVVGVLAAAGLLERVLARAAEAPD